MKARWHSLLLVAGVLACLDPIRTWRRHLPLYDTGLQGTSAGLTESISFWMVWPPAAAKKLAKK
jgi:hypothetical protein